VRFFPGLNLEEKMKKILFGAALAALISAPAFAQVAVEIAPEVREYVIKEGRASSVTIDGDVAVGAVLPADVEIHTIEGIPTATKYRYAVVNNKRVIVEPSTRKVIQVVQ
jgi:hypothetical protein